MPNVPTAAETEAALRERYGARFHLLEGHAEPTSSALFNESSFARHWAVSTNLKGKLSGDFYSDLHCYAESAYGSIATESIQSCLLDASGFFNYGAEPHFAHIKKLEEHPLLQQYIAQLTKIESDDYMTDWLIIATVFEEEGSTFWVLNINPGSVLYEHVLYVGQNAGSEQIMHLSELIADVETLLFVNYDETHSLPDNSDDTSEAI